MPELFIAKYCPALPFGKRVSVFVPDAYNISPFVKLVIPLVDVIMMSFSRSETRVSSEDTPGAALHSGTPLELTVNTLPAVVLMASFESVEFPDAYNISPFVKFVVIPDVFVIMGFASSVLILDELEFRSV